MRRILRFGCIVGVLLIVCAVIFWVFVGSKLVGPLLALQPAGTAFMTAVKNGDYDTAYRLVGAEAQATFGNSPDGMKQLFQSNGWDTVSAWTFDSFSVNNSDGSLSGTVTLAKGTASLTLKLIQFGNTWLVTGFNAVFK